MCWSCFKKTNPDVDVRNLLTELFTQEMQTCGYNNMEDPRIQAMRDRMVDVYEKGKLTTNVGTFVKSLAIFFYSCS